MEPLQLLYERAGPAGAGLPLQLAELYGGDLGFDTPCVIANFVSSVDGVVALGTAEESGHLISGGNEADQFVMGLLRACAGAVLLGAGTFRKSGGHLWHADHVYPAAAARFAELRRNLGLRPQPPLVLVTATGEIDPAQPALRDAIVVTTPAGESRLRGQLPDTARIVAGPIRLREVIELLRSEGVRVLLSEGGPSLVAQLAEEKLLDELFLTSSPRLFGRWPGDGRKGLIDGLDLRGTPLELLSARRHGSFLFLRYALPR